MTRPKRSNMDLRVITQYNNQWTDVRNILTKNWDVLKSDICVGPNVTDRPLLTARRAPNLRDQLTRSHFNRPRTQVKCGRKATVSFPCGECSICCHVIPTKKFTNRSDGKQYMLKNYINSKTKNVVYGLVCPCNKLYIGHTSQQLLQRNKKHFSIITLADRDSRSATKLTTVAEHYKEFHSGKIRGTQVIGERGGEITPILLQRESRWIFNTNSHIPNRVNAEITFIGFFYEPIHAIGYILIPPFVVLFQLL